VYAEIPANMEGQPVIGLIAHMDTAPAVATGPVHASVIRYEGGDITLASGALMKPSDYECLNRHVGHELIVTDGTTLLGADDKAGVAEIMSAAEFLLRTRMNHATLKIGFTPDEEIGRGADRFDVAKFAADYAYTVDGGTIGELEYENFNAAGATVEFVGRNIHPGSAKNQMVNSQYIAMEFQSLLPAAQKPEHTENYEGFIHLAGMEGEVEKTTLWYIVRDHDMTKFLEKKSVMEAAAAFLNAKYGEGTVKLNLKDSYFNMREKIEPCMFIVERAKKAMEAVGIKPVTVPIRGGTDGARLSYMGLPCPNLCTGGANYHSRFEYVPVEDMEKITQMLVQLLTTVE
jgi:tripeptide aminopeptidase